MDQLLQQFIKKYTGLTGQGNTDANKGQCVGLVSLWQDVLGVPHEFGNASDLLANANPSFFQVIQNDPNNLSQFPVPGDIMVWGTTWGGGFGHTGIVTGADGTTFSTFEQNDHSTLDPSGACEILNHGYDGVLGWLHFIGALPQPTATQILAGETELDTHGLDITNIASVQVALDIWYKVSQNLFVPVEQFNSLNTNYEQLKEDYATLNTKYTDAFKELTDTKKELSDLHTSDYNFGQEALDAQKQNSDTMKLLKKIYDSDGLDTTGKTDTQLVDEVIQDLAKTKVLEQAQEGQATPEGISTFYQNFAKSIITYAIDKGINPFLQANGWHVVDPSGNVVDNQLFDKMKLFFDDAFSKRDLVIAGLKSGGAYVAKAKSLWQMFIELFVKPTS